MFFKYFRVYVIDLPKKIPPDAKLRIKFIHREGVNHEIKWVTDESYKSSFYYKYGSLNEGFREVSTGDISCWKYTTLEASKNDLAKIKKDWGAKELKKIRMVRVIGIIDSLCAYLAIRAVLVDEFGLKHIYDGFPFCKIFKVK
jgi:hypothetical protein|tara:strand:+ start:293 stop:721 length:429 start_codon:yes stop_codon:yes gene_type:complete